MHSFELNHNNNNNNGWKDSTVNLIVISCCLVPSTSILVLHCCRHWTLLGMLEGTSVVVLLSLGMYWAWIDLTQRVHRVQATLVRRAQQHLDNIVVDDVLQRLLDPRQATSLWTFIGAVSVAIVAYLPLITRKHRIACVQTIMGGSEEDAHALLCRPGGIQKLWEMYTASRDGTIRNRSIVHDKSGITLGFIDSYEGESSSHAAPNSRKTRGSHVQVLDLSIATACHDQCTMSYERKRNHRTANLDHTRTTVSYPPPAPPPPMPLSIPSGEQEHERDHTPTMIGTSDDASSDFSIDSHDRIHSRVDCVQHQSANSNRPVHISSAFPSFIESQLHSSHPPALQARLKSYLSQSFHHQLSSFIHHLPSESPLERYLCISLGILSLQILCSRRVRSFLANAVQAGILAGSMTMATASLSLLLWQRHHHQSLPHERTLREKKSTGSSSKCNPLEQQFYQFAHSTAHKLVDRISQQPLNNRGSTSSTQRSSSNSFPLASSALSTPTISSWKVFLSHSVDVGLHGACSLVGNLVRRLKCECMNSSIISRPIRSQESRVMQRRHCLPAIFILLVLARWKELRRRQPHDELSGSMHR